MQLEIKEKIDPIKVGSILTAYKYGVGSGEVFGRAEVLEVIQTERHRVYYKKNGEGFYCRNDEIENVS